MDRRQALEAFEAYVSSYGPENPRIALKIDHTLRVAALCERIAESRGCSREDVSLAWLLGLLHDIGRFEQVRRFDSYNDAATLDHAGFGVEVLFSSAGDDARETDAAENVPFIRAFLSDDANDEVIRLAVGLHSAYRLPDDLDKRTRTMCEILRDADKIDILKVVCTCPIEDVYGISERAMAESELSPACVELFYQHQCLLREIRRFPADVLLGHVCFAWELVFDESLEIIREQGYLREMLNRSWARSETSEAFSAMAAHMAAELGI